MVRGQQRHDISDRAWEKIRPYTIGEKGTHGGNARDTRQFIKGVFWILRTGAPREDLLETYGNSENVHRWFCRWRDKRIWERILEPCVDNRGINQYLMALAKEQIRLAFDQAEKEVEDLHQRTREGIQTARLNGKQTGQR